MPNVTVLGANGSGGQDAVWSIPYTASANFSLAQDLANQITTGILGASLTSQMWNGALPPATGASILDIGGKAADSFTGDAVSANVTLNANYVGVVDNSTLPVTITGVGSTTPITVLAGQGGLTFNSGLGAGGVGSGFILDGGGSNNLYNIAQTSIAGGGYWIAPGDGANTVHAGGGNNTITGARGSSNWVDLTGFGNNIVASSGAETVSAASGHGSDTVGIGNSNPDTLLISMGDGWTGQLFFGDTSTVTGSAITVSGGGGSVTLFGGVRQDVFFGGSAGDNIIVAGADPSSSITGGGNGDELFAGFFGGGIIQAGTGNETLVGVGRPGIPGAASVAGTAFFGNTLTGGANIFAGAGADTITSGVGNENFYGNPTGKGDFFTFSHSITGAAGAQTNVMIHDFTVGKDTVALSNYGYSSAQQVVDDITKSGGNSSLQLTDGTKIEFTNVTTLTAISIFSPSLPSPRRSLLDRRGSQRYIDGKGLTDRAALQLAVPSGDPLWEITREGCRLPCLRSAARDRGSGDRRARPR
jgi:hypothetical protein